MHYRVRTLVVQEYVLFKVLIIKYLRVKQKGYNCKIQETNVRKTKYLIPQNTLKKDEANKYYFTTLKRAKRSSNCFSPAFLKRMVALALSPVPSTFTTSPSPKRSCSMDCPT